MVRQLKNYVGGRWVEATTDKYTSVINPATCETLAECPDSPAADVDAAVKAAQEGYREWRSTPVLSRA
ncbi:partial Malonate-semialdehyde dehydrogenase, partial [Anaerolineae bacterium]